MALSGNILIADRIDVFKKDGKAYIKIVDYKTGDKTFKESDIKKGKNLQLLIYLFSLCEVADARFFEKLGVSSTDDILPAGAVYFVVKSPEIKKESLSVTAAEAIALAEAEYSRTGCIFSAEELAGYIDSTTDKRFSKKLKAKSNDETELLYEEVRASIADIAAKMRSGMIDTSETAIGEKSPCRYCEYTHVCRRMTKGDSDEA